MSFQTKAISNTVNFKIGQEFEEKNPGGKVVKVPIIAIVVDIILLHKRLWLLLKTISWSSFLKLKRERFDELCSSQRQE